MPPTKAALMALRPPATDFGAPRRQQREENRVRIGNQALLRNGIGDTEAQAAGPDIAPPYAGNQALLRVLPRASGLRPSRIPLLQRQCACGGAAGISAECAECREKKDSALHR